MRDDFYREMRFFSYGPAIEYAVRTISQAFFGCNTGTIATFEALSQREKP